MKKTASKENTIFAEFFPRKNDADWISLGSCFRNFVYPPRIDDNVRDFSDGLYETIKEKLKIALDAQKTLENQRELTLRKIEQGIPAKDQWFFLEFEASLFAEFYIISKWVGYWLNLWDIINDTPKNIPNSWVNNTDIQNAKSYPIKNLYKGHLRKFGEKYAGLCPFHEERHPSFFIFPDNHWYCFGACGKGGDSIDFLMKLKNIGFLDAVKELTHGYN
jgi:hypothetical protein